MISSCVAGVLRRLIGWYFNKSSDFLFNCQ